MAIKKKVLSNKKSKVVEVKKEEAEVKEIEKVIEVEKVVEIPAVTQATNNLMAQVLKTVAIKFKLNEQFIMTSFSDKGSNCSITLNSKDFKVTVAVKNLDCLVEVD